MANRSLISDISQRNSLHVLDLGAIEEQRKAARRKAAYGTSSLMSAHAQQPFFEVMPATASGSWLPERDDEGLGYRARPAAVSAEKRRHRIAVPVLSKLRISPFWRAIFLAATAFGLLAGIVLAAASQMQEQGRSASQQGQQLNVEPAPQADGSIPRVGPGGNAWTLWGAINPFMQSAGGQTAGPAGGQQPEAAQPAPLQGGHAQPVAPGQPQPGTSDSTPATEPAPDSAPAPAPSTPLPLPKLELPQGLTAGA